MGLYLKGGGGFRKEMEGGSWWAFVKGGLGDEGGLRVLDTATSFGACPAQHMARRWAGIWWIIAALGCLLGAADAVHFQSGTVGYELMEGTPVRMLPTLVIICPWHRAGRCSLISASILLQHGRGTLPPHIL